MLNVVNPIEIQKQRRAESDEQRDGGKGYGLEWPVCVQKKANQTIDRMILYGIYCRPVSGQSI